jgi:hypothetical protein
VKTTRQFALKMAMRTDIQLHWIERAITSPVVVEEQGNGWFRMWGYIEETDRFLRVITLEDRETVQNAFWDRGFGRKR